MGNFINFTNHPTYKWNDKQLKEARQFGEIIDIQFPNVSPYATDEELEILAIEYIEKIQRYKPQVVLVQGEFNLSFKVILFLLEQGIKVVSATSERCSIETFDIEKNTKKISQFKFVKFREYKRCDSLNNSME